MDWLFIVESYEIWYVFSYETKLEAFLDYGCLLTLSQLGHPQPQMGKLTSKVLFECPQDLQGHTSHGTLSGMTSWSYRILDRIHGAEEWMGTAYLMQVTCKTEVGRMVS